MADLQWDITIPDMKRTVKDYIKIITSHIDRICKQKKQDITFDDTFGELNRLYNKYNYGVNQVMFMQHIATDEKVRKYSAEAETIIGKFHIRLASNKSLYKVAKYIYENKTGLDEDTLTYLEFLLREYKRSGMGLDNKTFNIVKQLNEELLQLCTEYSININESNVSILLTRSELEGLSDLFIDALDTENKNGQTKYVVTAKYPHIYPILETADKEETRRKVLKMVESQCVQNVELLFTIIKKRQEIATLLGYESWAAYILEINMARNVDTVNSFLLDLIEKLRPLRNRELEDMMANKHGIIEQYDWRYYLEKHKQNEFKIDTEAIREYFPLEHVLDRMFAYFQDLLELRFERAQGESTWHPDCTKWVVYDGNSDLAKITGDSLKIGVFYLDLFPRPNKFNHAACFPLKYGTKIEPIAICAMVCNFSASTDTIPSLLTHSEVETLYHEFGHVMHNICSRPHFLEFSGTQTEKDFVEAPSQMLENWCWEKTTIRELSYHYRTGEPMPDNIITKLVGSRHVGSGILNCRQLAFAVIDMLLHTKNIESANEMENIVNSVTEEVMGIANIPESHRIAIFGHIAGGYDAQYYGYMWSLVYASDMYTALQEYIREGKPAGRLYRDLILAPGGSKDPEKMLNDFLGRNPTNDAFLRNLGL
jgi:Zn-dependent oligopeptidase